MFLGRCFKMRDAIEDPFKSLRVTIAFGSRDWSTDEQLAWIYAIVVGWQPDGMKELARKFAWDDATVARLKRLRAVYAALGAAYER